MKLTDCAVLTAGRRMRPAAALLTAVFLFGTLMNSFVTTASAQDAASPAAANEKPLIEGLTEPDEKPPEIRDESSAIDPSNKDALAWYMTGQKALKQGDLDVAAEAFQKSADADIKSAVPVRALAMVYFRMGKAREGLEKAQQAMEMDPHDYQTRLELAVLLGTNRSYTDAFSLIEEALESDRLEKKSFDFVHIHQVRAAILLELRKLTEAANSYEIILRALETPEEFQLTDREHQTLLRNRITSYEVTGRILMEAGRIPRAVQAFEALARSENDAPGEHNLLLSRAYFQQDKLDLCETNLNRYFETGRRASESLLLLRDLYEATSRSDSLNQRLQELTEDASDASAVRMFLGQVLLDQGEIGKAADVYQSILDTTGEVDAYVGLVRVQIAHRNSRALVATVNRAVKSRITLAELSPLVSSIATIDGFAGDTIKSCLSLIEEKPGDVHPLVPFFCSLIAEQIERPDDESELLKVTLELNPDRDLTISTLDKYGMNQLRKGEFARAARIFEQMLETPGLQPMARVNTLFRISLAYAQIEDLNAARNAIRQALRLIPDEPQLLGRLALVEAAAGNMEEAAKIMQKSIDGLDGNQEMLVDSRVRLAGIFAQMRQWDKAVEQYSLILEISSLEPEMKRLARMGLSNAYVQGGDMLEGEKVLEEVYEEDPDDPGVNNDLGYLYADQGKNLEQAEKMIRIAVESQPGNPAYLDSLGWVLYRLGRYEEALEPLKQANADPSYQDATLLEHEGDVHQAMKNSDEARTLWQRALDVENESKKPDETVIRRLKEKLADPKTADPAPVTPEEKPR